ncbi:MAG: helix-turn-helix domain-containing protein [Christensenellales bacterium]
MSICKVFFGYIMYKIDNAEISIVHLRIIDILKIKGRSKYWLYIQTGLSYQNFNKILNNETSGIKFENLKMFCDILECTPNDLFEEYYK